MQNTRGSQAVSEFVEVDIQQRKGLLIQAPSIVSGINTWRGVSGVLTDHFSRAGVLPGPSGVTVISGLNVGVHVTHVLRRVPQDALVKVRPVQVTGRNDLALGALYIGFA